MSNMPEKNYINRIQDERIKTIEEHIKIINNELGNVKVDLAIVKTDVKWLKKYFWVVVSSSVGALVVGLINFLIKI